MALLCSPEPRLDPAGNWGKRKDGSKLSQPYG
jgi:hypothetical protein